MVTVDRLTTNWVGLSSDPKPTECRNGDTYVEIDTSTLYAYDEENQQWLKQYSGGGSDSGGSSEAESATVTFINSADGCYYDVLINGATYSISDSQTVTIELVGGYAYIPFDNFTYINEEVQPIATGEIELEHTRFKVTGDGTITIVGTGTGDA